MEKAANTPPRQRPPAIGVAGWKNSGKTTLVTRLVAELSRRGFKVATVKHAHHAFRIDDAETDSARHRRAGAAQVAIVSARRWALVRELGADPEPTLDEMIGRLDSCDLVIVEGYKRAPIPKIEVRRRPRLRWRGQAGVPARGCRRHRRFHRPAAGPGGTHLTARGRGADHARSRAVPRAINVRHARVRGALRARAAALYAGSPETAAQAPGAAPASKQKTPILRWERS
jgi:molybdopterin-guanine dinucleotide biosynthesis protein MobB